MISLSPDERQRLMLSVGTHRSSRPLSPVEVARLFEKATKSGASLQECASAVHFQSTSTVSRFLSLLQLAPDIQHLVDWGQTGSTMSFSTAFELSRLSSSDQLEVAEAVLAHGLSSVEVRQLVQRRKRSGRPLSECVDETLQMRPQIVRRHVFIGAVILEQARSKLTSMSQDERDAMLREAIRDAFPELGAVAVRMGTARFTLVGSDEMAALLRTKDFERTINDGLEGRIAT